MVRGQLGYMFKVELKFTGFTDKLNEKDRTRGGKDDNKVLSLSNLSYQFTEIKTVRRMQGGEAQNSFRYRVTNKEMELSTRLTI